MNARRAVTMTKSLSRVACGVHQLLFGGLQHEHRSFDSARSGSGLESLSPLASLDVDAAQHGGHNNESPPAFVEAVRQATEQFRDVRNVPAECGPVLGCVSGPEEGAMGVHFVNPALLTDGAVYAAQPEALICEFKNGAARLVGVEYIRLGVARQPQGRVR